MDINPKLRSVVALRATIPDDAFTAGGLGTLREGSGIVIRESGLVLTIGYLITEAEEVWLTTIDGRVVPAHALFSADVGKYGPYSPSSRIFLNVLHADPAAALGHVRDDPGPPDTLIDWPSAARRKLDRLRTLYEAAADHPGFVDYRNEAGAALESHARFEALHAHLLARDPALWGWRDWPAEFQTPDSPGVTRFARDNPAEPSPVPRGPSRPSPAPVPNRVTLLSSFSRST